MQIINIVNKYHLQNPHRLQIILGDFNTYFDFQFPMDLLTLNLKYRDNEMLKQYLLSKCMPLKRQKYLFKNDVGPFNDAWKDIYGKDIDVMRTFTNFQDYRIEDFTITDRILYRNGKQTKTKQNPTQKWNVCDVWIAGDSALNNITRDYFPSDHRTVIAKLYYN